MARIRRVRDGDLGMLLIESATVLAVANRGRALVLPRDLALRRAA